MNEAEIKDYNELLDCMKNQCGSYDIPLIKKAFEFCVEYHNGQKRLTNEAYYIHPFNVAKIIVTLGMDSQSIAAALLHDIGRGMQYGEGVHHDEASVLLAGHILPECGFSAVQTKEICDAIAGHRMSSEVTECRTDLGKILEEADHASRCCFACGAEPECYWPKEKKNLEIRM